MITNNLVIFIQCDTGYITLCHFQITGAFLQSTIHGTNLAPQSLAQILKSGADGQSVLGKRALRTSVYDLQEQLSHSGVDSVAYKICIQSFHYCQSGKNLRSHSGRMSHAGAADGFYQSFLDDSLFYIQGQLTCALLGSTPAYAMCQTGNVFYLLCLNPFRFFRDGGATMMYTLSDCAHFFNFL